MKARLALAAWLGLSLAALLASAQGEAAEIKVLSTVGMQPATPELFAQFESATGHRVVVTYGLAAVLKTKFLEGAPADVLILTAPIVEDLAKQGKVVADSKKDVARSGVGVAVKAGAPKPDISTPEALKAAVLSAKSIGYSREGASGVAFARVVERLGIADQVRAKYKDTGTKAGEMVAAGGASDRDHLLGRARDRGTRLRRRQGLDRVPLRPSRHAGLQGEGPGRLRRRDG